jgi:hypothetical protein
MQGRAAAESLRPLGYAWQPLEAAVYESQPVPIAKASAPKRLDETTSPFVPIAFRGSRGPRVDLHGAVPSLERRWDADEHGRFPCPVPGHKGHALLGVPPDDKDQDIRLLCCSGLWRSLGEIRAAESYGEDVRRSNIEIATWLRRLLYECGRFEPISVPMRRLPLRADRRLMEAATGFALLAGLRSADGPRRPLAYSVRFCAAWCALSSATPTCRSKSWCRRA